MVSEHKVETLGLDEAQLAFYETVNLNYFYWCYFFFMLFNRENCFWSLTIGMERLEEYAEEESPFTEQENLPRDPI